MLKSKESCKISGEIRGTKTWLAISTRIVKKKRYRYLEREANRRKIFVPKGDGEVSQQKNIRDR